MNENQALRKNGSAIGDGEAITLVTKGSSAVAVGRYCAATVTGSLSCAAAEGHGAIASAYGAHSTAVTGADEGEARVLAANSVAVSVGALGKASAARGSWLVLAEHDENGQILAVKAAKAGEGGIIPGALYMLIGGEFVEQLE